MLRTWKGGEQIMAPELLDTCAMMYGAGSFPSGTIPETLQCFERLLAIPGCGINESERTRKAKQQ